MKSALSLLTVLAALSVRQGDAVRCYVCSSERDPTCKDPFLGVQHEHQLTHCTADAMRNIDEMIPGVYFNPRYSAPTSDQFVCVKAVTRDNGHMQVARSCAVPRPDTFDFCAQMKSRDLVHCETCSGDACNGATPRASAASAILALALAAAAAASAGNFARA